MGWGSFSCKSVWFQVSWPDCGNRLIWGPSGGVWPSEPVRSAQTFDPDGRSDEVAESRGWRVRALNTYAWLPIASKNPGIPERCYCHEYVRRTRRF